MMTENEYRYNFVHLNKDNEIVDLSSHKTLIEALIKFDNTRDNGLHLYGSTIAVVDTILDRTIQQYTFGVSIK